MGLRPSSRRDTAAHTDALGRLGDALDRQHDLEDRAQAAEGTSGEQHAADELGAARNEVAAREAWVVWTERGL